MSRCTPLSFAKGHGTENDFVLVPDPGGDLELTPQLVRWLADRRGGLGADGVIRVVPTAHAGDPAVRSLAPDAPWFMDYWNADGGTAEMCGNGARVFAAYLRSTGRHTADVLVIATRSGPKSLRWEGELIAVDLGAWRLAAGDTARAAGDEEAATADRPVVRVGDSPVWGGVRVDVGTPHTVVALPPQLDLATLDLSREPVLDPYPHAGSNVEFSQLVEPGHLRMRVYERGVGETRSCGTGAAATALAWQAGNCGNGSRTGPSASGTPSRWRVDVPGGTLWVRPLPDQRVELLGPATLVAEGTVYPPDPL